MKIPKDAKQSNNVIDVTYVTARQFELEDLMSKSATEIMGYMQKGENGPQELIDKYNEYAKEFNKLQKYIESTGIGTPMQYPNEPVGPASMEEAAQNYDKFLYGKQDDPSDPYDIPPSRAPIPTPSPRSINPNTSYTGPVAVPEQAPRLDSPPHKVKTIKYARGGLVDLLPDSMMGSPLLNHYSVANETGLRSLMRATETNPSTGYN